VREEWGQGSEFVSYSTNSMENARTKQCGQDDECCDLNLEIILTAFNFNYKENRFCQSIFSGDTPSEKNCTAIVFEKCHLFKHVPHIKNCHVLKALRSYNKVIRYK
jgi:hypothetical protein